MREENQSIQKEQKELTKLKTKVSRDEHMAGFKRAISKPEINSQRNLKKLNLKDRSKHVVSPIELTKSTQDRSPININVPQSLKSSSYFNKIKMRYEATREQIKRNVFNKSTSDHNIVAVEPIKSPRIALNHTKNTRSQQFQYFKSK